MLFLLGFARFPQISGSLVPYVALAVAGMLIIVLPAALILRITRDRAGPIEPARSRSLLIGGALGVIWIAYTLITHIVIPNNEQPVVNSALLWSALSLAALAFLIDSFTVGFQCKRFTTGLGAGLAVGFISGVLAMLTIGVMLDVGMGALVRNMNAGELQGFASSGWTNRQAWYYWNEELFGALGDYSLLLLGAAVFGSIGAAMGRLLSAYLHRPHWPGPA